MERNVGKAEKVMRIAAGVAAGAAALKTTGWQRATLGAVATAGLGTGFSGYCPINQAVGRDSYHATPRAGSRLEEGLRDTELRRQAQMNSALGTAPTTATDQPRVSRASDVFGRIEEPPRG